MMDTSAAKNELKRVLKTLRAAEHMDEILKVAVLAEQHQQELEQANEKLVQKLASMSKELEALDKLLEETQSKHKKVLAQFNAENKEQLDRLSAAEDSVKSALENTKQMYKKKTEELDNEFEAKKTKSLAFLEDLDRKILDSQALLEDTRSKFQAIA